MKEWAGKRGWAGAGYLHALYSRMQELGDSTQAIRASVLTDGWNFRTAPPPEAKLFAASKWIYRWAQQPREFVEMQG